MKKKVGAIVLIVFIIAIVISTEKYNNSDIQFELNLNQMSQSNDKCIMFERQKLEESISEMYILNGPGIESFRSALSYVSELYKILPFNNVKKYENGYVIKYNTEETTFAVITNREGGITDMIYYSDKMPESEYFKEIKKGMTYENVKKIYPEMILSTKLPKFVMGGGKRENPVGEIIFCNGDIGQIKFEQKGKEYYVIETNIAMKISNETMKLLD